MIYTIASIGALSRVGQLSEAETSQWYTIPGVKGERPLPGNSWEILINLNYGDLKIPNSSLMARTDTGAFDEERVE
jgi:hypothetical protein